MMITRVAGRGSFPLGLLLMCVVACSEHPVADIDRIREVGEPGPVGATTQERFFQDAGMPQQGGVIPPAGSIADMLEWDVPAGWEELPPQQFRDINLRIGAVECYVSVLGGGGGGAEPNINRWRGQMGLPALSHQEFDALARATLFGVDVPFVDIEGTYLDKPDQRMVAVFFEAPMAAITVKMLGPRAEVAAERAHFEEFCASLDVADSPGGEQQPQAEGAGAIGDGSFDASRLRWDVPVGWTKSGAQAMRFVTFETVDGAECYISFLGGAAGGLAANLNRWRNQIGMSPLSSEEIASLPAIPLLEGQSPFLEAYSDSGLAVLGSVVSVPSQTMFIKMVGNEASVRAEVDRFKAFCKSLRLEND